MRILLLSVLGLAVGVTGCFDAPKFMKPGTAKLGGTGLTAGGSGGTDGGETQEVATTVDEQGVTEGTVSADSEVTQLISAAEGSEVAGASISIPSGAIALDTTISIEAGASIASSAVAAELGLEGVSEVSATGTAVVVKSSTAQDATKPFTVSIALGDSAALTADSASDRLVIIYRVARNADGKVLSGIIPRSALKIENGVVSFEITYFGSYQAAYTDVVVEQAKVVETAAPILTKTEAKTLPEVTWGDTTVGYVATAGTITVESVPTGAKMVQCAVLVDRNKTSPWDWRAKSKTPKATVTDNRTEAYSVYGRVECIDEHGRATASAWSKTAASIPADPVASDCSPNDPSTWQMLSYLSRDADGDGKFVDDTGTVCSGASLPAGFAATLTVGEPDCNDSANWAWKIHEGYVDEDGDGFGAGALTPICAGAGFPSNVLKLNADDAFPTDPDNSSAEVIHREEDAGQDNVEKVRFDASGNRYTIVWLAGATNFSEGTAQGDVAAAGVTDSVIVKHDAGGNFVWFRQLGETGASVLARQLEIDATGNIVVAGEFADGAVRFDPGVGAVYRTPLGSTDIFVVKFAPNGDFQWVHTAGTIMNETPDALAIDNSGNVYVTGHVFCENGLPFYFDANALSNQQACHKATSGGEFDMPFFKLSSAGDLQEHHLMGVTTSWERGQALAIDNSKVPAQVVLGGYYMNTTDLDPSVGVATVSGGGQVNEMDHFIARYSTTDLSYISHFTFGGAPGRDEVTAINVQPSGRMLIAGFFSSAIDFDKDGAGNATRTPMGSRNAYLVSYSDTDAFEWVNVYEATGDSVTYIREISVGAAGHIHLAGGYQGALHVNPADPSDVRMNATALPWETAAFAQKLLSTGSVVWTLTGNGPNADSHITSIAEQTLTGDLFLAGFNATPTTLSFSQTFPFASFTATSAREAFLIRIQ